MRQPQWRKDGGQYIPHPATWLRQERWEDEPFHLPTEIVFEESHTQRTRRILQEARVAREIRH